MIGVTRAKLAAIQESIGIPNVRRAERFRKRRDFQRENAPALGARDLGGRSEKS